MSAFSNLIKSEKNQISENIKDFFKAGDENINFKTELDMQEIEMLSKLELQARMIKKEFGVTTLYDDATRLYKEQKVSHKRKGRKEWVEVSKPEAKKDEGNKLKRMLGL